MSEKKNKYPLGLFYLKGNLILKFKNNVELAKYLNISKFTAGKYLNSGLVYNNTYRFKPIISEYYFKGGPSTPTPPSVVLIRSRGGIYD